MDRLNSKWGQRSAFYAASGVKREWVGTSALRSRHYTTDWNSLIEVRAH
jgi:hypothetical protein